jgi:hypothetical protein
MSPDYQEVGIGATAELTLRVSVATLVRVLFSSPSDSELMLALERKATLRETATGRAFKVKCQPFGGAIRILDLKTLNSLLGDFRFDGERSRTEHDFRIFIRPSAWTVLRDFCLQHITLDNDHVIETDPTRELVEEFADTLAINLKPDQYVCKPVTTIVENKATPTANIHARGVPTVRIYRIFEASIIDLSLTQVMLMSGGLSHQDLYERSSADAQNGGRGRANAISALPWSRLADEYRAMSASARNMPITFESNQLTPTVAALFDQIAVPRYQLVE